MPFDRGQVSFGRFAVGSPAANTVTQQHLDRLSEHTLSTTEIGAPRATESGWCAGEHMMDEAFSFEKNAFDGGSLLHAALRIDTNTVPAEVKRAIRAQQEAAVAGLNPSGRLARAQRSEVKELVEHALHDELATGKHRRSKLVPLLWDLPGRVLLSSGMGSTAIEQLGEQWRHAFDGSLRALSAGGLAHDLAVSLGRTSALENCVPSAFGPPPVSAGDEDDDAAGSQKPEVPWAAVSPEPLDFLGNEFLLWLWFVCEKREGIVEARAESGATDRLQVSMDRTLEMECAWGVTGRQTLRGDAEGISPVRMREAYEALAVGKWPRKAGLLLADDSHGFSLTLQGDKWLVSGCVLPQPDEPIEEPREQREYRLDLVRRVDGMLVGMLGAFVHLRTGDRWNDEKRQIREWVASHRGSRG